MRFLVRFHDIDEGQDLRASNLDSHLAWLEAHQSTVLIAGSIRIEADTRALGGVWLVETDSRETLDALIATDPFSIVGLRQRYEIHHFSPAFPGRTVLI